MMNFYEDKNIKSAYYSLIGENHIKQSCENQDSICCEVISQSKWVIAVADGVSSARFAKKGSHFATEVVKELANEFELTDQLNLDELKVWFVRKWKSKISSDWNEYASTINFAYYSNNYLLVGQIGDGLICVDIDGKKKAFGIDEEFYTSETYALGEVVKKNSFILNLERVKSNISLYMVSDGIGKEIDYDSRLELGVYLGILLLQDKEHIEEEIMSWLDALNNKNGDDKSIAFINWEV